MKRNLLTLITLIGIALGLNAQPLLQNGNISVTTEEGGIQLLHGDRAFAEIQSFSFNFIPARIREVKPAGKDTIHVRLSMTDKDGHREDFPSEINLRITLTGKTVRFYTTHETFRHITIKMKDLNEHYFGLIEKLYPENRKSPDLRGETVDVEVYALGERDYAENYASAYSAFFMSSNGYGSFFDTFAKGRYQFAKNGVTEIYHQTNTLDWYLFYGPAGDKIHREYFKVIGEPKAVPIWAVGPVIWRDDNSGTSGGPGGSQDILNDLQKFTEMKIPLTATFVDRPYSNGNHEWSKMDFSEKFANPEEWISIINDKYGMEFMSWVGSLTFGDEDFPGLLPNFKGYIDLTHPEALAEFEKRMSRQYAVGVKGHKMDRADENFPMTAQWHEPISESESRNKYVYLYSKVIHEFLERAHGEDQFNFARAAFHRSQPYLSAIWGGDNRSNWKGMAGNMANAVRSSFMGFPVWGNDTGGYLGEGYIDEHLYMRWLQWSAWNGMFEVKIDGMGGRGKDRAPWRYSEKLQEVFRNVTEQRMLLLPYAYSLANTSAQYGVLMKPMAYAYPFDENIYKMWDQYIFGNTFLIAPLFSEQNTREIYLPEGSWYNYYNLSENIDGGTFIERNVPEDHIPVFVKANSIYVSGEIYRGNSKLWKGELTGEESLTIHLFPGEEGAKVDFTYVDYLDEDRKKKMTLTHSEGEIQFSSPALTISAKIEMRLDSKPAFVQVNDSEVDFEYSEAELLVKFAIPKGKEIEVVVQ